MTIVPEISVPFDGINSILENTGVVTADGWRSHTDLTTDIMVAG